MKQHFNFLSSPFTKERRINLCRVCPKMRTDFKLFGIVIFKRTMQCKVCKCAIDLKVSFKDSKCPRGKW